METVRNTFLISVFVSIFVILACWSYIINSSIRNVVPVLHSNRVSFLNVTEYESIRTTTDLDCRAIREERHQGISSACAALPSQNKLQGSFLLVEDEHKVLYCFIPKAGCTSMFNVLAEATSTGDKSKHRKNPLHVHQRGYMVSMGVTGFRSFSAAKQVEILANYTKFIIVRHPIQRLVSAYWDKMAPRPDLNRDYIKMRQGVVNASHPNATADQLKHYQPSFREFITQMGEAKWKDDKHWRPYYSLCEPCAIHYDYVIKLESIQSDIVPVLKILAGGNKTVEKHLASMVGSKNSHSPHNLKPDVIHEMLNLSLSQRNELEHRYKLDLQLYGYDFDSLTAEADYGTADVCDWKNM